MQLSYYDGAKSVALGGLSGCSGQLTPEQVFQIAMNAGFPAATATKMVAIAMRESSLCPSATNIHDPGTTSATDPGEESYGLWQINVGPKGNKNLPAQMGLSSHTQLLDPSVNAKAAYILWGGNDNNLNTAWYLNRSGYSEAYLANLPRAQQAAQTVLGGSAPDVSGDGGGDISSALTVVAVGVAGYLLLDQLTS